MKQIRGRGKGHVKVNHGGNEIMGSTCDTGHTSLTISLTRIITMSKLAPQRASFRGN